MSNPTTNYTVGGLDLSNIFQPLVQGSAIGYNTNYTVSGHGDLRNIFAAYTGATGTQAPVTGYSVTGHGDLNTIFAKKILYIITGSLTYTVYTYGGYTGIAFTAGSGGITFFANILSNLIAVGGGGAGGPNGEAGGGGGTVNFPNFNVVANTLYGISVGGGGAQPSGNGGNAQIGPYIGYGGYGGVSNISGSGGSTNTTAGGGGGGGAGATPLFPIPGSGGQNSLGGNVGEGGVASGSTPQPAGGRSYYMFNGNQITLPFISGSPTLYPGAGGGFGTSPSFVPSCVGGQAGTTVGGSSGAATTVPIINGESGVSSLTTWIFGGGGGGPATQVPAPFPFDPPTNGIPGNGGSGVVIIYWQTV